MNTQETVRPVPVPTSRKSLSTTTSEVSLPSNMTTSETQVLCNVTGATHDTCMNNHEAPAESSSNSAMTTT